MKKRLDSGGLPAGALLILGSSHEERCAGVVSRIGTSQPAEALLFHYDDANSRRELNQAKIEAALTAARVPITKTQFAESSAVASLRENMAELRAVLDRHHHAPVVLDISVLTKRHLLMTLRWLDDQGVWDRLWVVYTEPTDYDVSRHIPLSFGLASMQQVPGFSACPDLSRPVHLALFLGYEGDRARAVYEHVEPMRTTLIVPHPPYKPDWAGRTERFNADLLALVGEDCIEKLDSIDPAATVAGLRKVFDLHVGRSPFARIVSPLGTKPQTLGIYCYLRECNDPPALVYAGPLRHNHDFFSHGVGATWLLQSPP